MSDAAKSIFLVVVFGPTAAWLGGDLWKSLKSGVIKIRNVPYGDNPRYLIHRDERPINYWFCVAFGVIALGTAALMALIGVFFLIA